MTREELRDYVEEQRSLNNIPYHVYSALIDGIDTLEQEPRKGHWIYTAQQRLVKETDDGGVYRTEYRCSCSECGGDFGFIKNKDAFCKFCGADMRGEEVCR